MVNTTLSSSRTGRPERSTGCPQRPHGRLRPIRSRRHGPEPGRIPAPGPRSAAAPACARRAREMALRQRDLIVHVGAFAVRVHTADAHHALAVGQPSRCRSASLAGPTPSRSCSTVAGNPLAVLAARLSYRQASSCVVLSLTNVPLPWRRETTCSASSAPGLAHGAGADAELPGQIDLGRQHGAGLPGAARDPLQNKVPHLEIERAHREFLVAGHDELLVPSSYQAQKTTHARKR